MISLAFRNHSGSLKNLQKFLFPLAVSAIDLNKDGRQVYTSCHILSPALTSFSGDVSWSQSLSWVSRSCPTPANHGSVINH